MATIVPNDGRLALDTDRRTLLVGLSAASVGTIAATLTTSAGRVLNIGVQVGDTTPDAFTFTALTNQAALTTITGNTITLTGYDTPLSFSLTGGNRLSVNGGAYIANGTVPVGATITPQITTPPAGGGTTVYQFAVGGTTGTWSVGVVAAAADKTIASVLGTKLVAFFDETDRNFMFSDSAGTVKVNDGDAVWVHKASNDTSKSRRQDTLAKAADLPCFRVQRQNDLHRVHRR